MIPGGISVRMIPADQCEDALMAYEDLQACGSGLGTGTMIVLDKDADLVKAIARAAYFYKHESCGQCTPCREGTGWMWRVMERMVTGEAEMSEIDLLLDVATQVEGHTICGLGDAAAWPIQGLFRHFRHEVEDRITQYRARQGATPAPLDRRRSNGMPNAKVDGVEVEFEPGMNVLQVASSPARRSRASATTSGCPSPATAACAWSR